MSNAQTKGKRIIVSLLVAIMIITTAYLLLACGDPENNKPVYEYTVGKYTINFGGNQEGESYDTGATTWKKSDENGFDAVFTLEGTVPYSKVTGDEVYGGLAYNIALIRFTSSVEKVDYDEEMEEGFYAIIYKNYGTPEQTESVRHGSFTTATGETSDNTFFLYNQIDETVRTKVVKISFDGTEENSALFKFVIDPDNYTLASAPEITAE